MKRIVFLSSILCSFLISMPLGNFRSAHAQGGNLADFNCDGLINNFDIDDNISFKFKSQMESIGINNDKLAGISLVMTF